MHSACREDLPNPHKNCLRSILNDLICHDNDLRRITLEIRNIQNDFQQEISKMESSCIEVRKAEAKDSMKTFTKKIATIDFINENYKTKAEVLKEERENTLRAAKKSLVCLTSEKVKFKAFHEKTIDYLKRQATKSDDPCMVQNFEKDICEMHRMFVKEVTDIKRTENKLKTMLEKLKEEFQSFYDNCCFKEYEWLPKGKNIGIVNDIADDIKESMGTTLKKAFAQMHIMQPQDSKSFLAAYLMNMQKNEEKSKEKLTLFGNI